MENLASDCRKGAVEVHLRPKSDCRLPSSSLSMQVKLPAQAAVRQKKGMGVS